MEKILSRIKFLYQFIVSSIGFYPTLISFIFFLLAIGMLYLETLGVSKSVNQLMPFFIISDGETARMVLSTISTGIISLTVFSFTMVMLVLNQAGSNFSPRVIPSLISYNSNQKVLGLYLGTLIYTLVIMVNIRSELYASGLPGLSIFLAMCFTFVCLGFFVYFIHSISQTIQIGSILEGIHDVTRKRLLKEIEQDEVLEIPNIFNRHDWVMLNSPESGYLQSIDKDVIVGICEEYDVILEFLHPLGSYLLQGIPFARISRSVKDHEKLYKRLYDHFNYFQEELADINYLFGIKQITESAVKALSPGINDPGTAVKAIDYLTDLLAIRMKLTDDQLLTDSKGVIRLRFAQETFENLIGFSLGPIRLYGKGDSIIVLRLLYLLQSLLYLVTAYPTRKPALYQEGLMLLHDAGEAIKNQGDRQRINEQVLRLNKINVLPEPFPLLPSVE